MPDYNFFQGSEGVAAVLLALIDDSPLGAQEKLDIAHSGQTLAELRAHCLAHMRSDAYRPLHRRWENLWRAYANLRRQLLNFRRHFADLSSP
jgi:hypothetical protein